ncbi:MAG TPA: hypothetical protein VNR18_06450 [Hyphomicrobiales bacterium]|nr:hypothetical protein [Hyphomicrobiales bacterium]
MKNVLALFPICLLAGCATIVNDPMTPIALSFSDGSSGTCTLENKRGIWSTNVPATVSVRRSDDTLRLRCQTEDGREAVSSIASEMGAEIVASAVFIDFGITDAITDKHRKYAPSFVVPIVAKQ